MLDARVRPWVAPPLERIAARLNDAGIGADLVTLAGFAVGVAAMMAIALEAYTVGLVLLLANRICDGVDGAVARRVGVTDRGGFLDIVLDFIVYSGIVFAFALADPQANALAAAFLIFAFVGTGSSFLAYAIMAARRGLDHGQRAHRSLYYLGGLTEGTETILAFVAFCLLPGWFPQLALLFGALCWVTTLSRVAIAWRSLA